MQTQSLRVFTSVTKSDGMDRNQQPAVRVVEATANLPLNMKSSRTNHGLSQIGQNRPRAGPGSGHA